MTVARTRRSVTALVALLVVAAVGLGFAVGRGTATATVIRYCPKGAVLTSQPDRSLSAPGCVDAPGR